MHGSVAKVLTTMKTLLPIPNLEYAQSRLRATSHQAQQKQQDLERQKQTFVENGNNNKKNRRRGDERGTNQNASTVRRDVPCK